MCFRSLHKIPVEKNERKQSNKNTCDVIYVTVVAMEPN